MTHNATASDMKQGSAAKDSQFTILGCSTTASRQLLLRCPITRHPWRAPAVDGL